jgi:hypothetical protein
MFDRVLNKKNSSNYINKVIILGDEDDEHYIHLISKTDNKAQIDIIISELAKFDK